MRKSGKKKKVGKKNKRQNKNKTKRKKKKEREKEKTRPHDFFTCSLSNSSSKSLEHKPFALLELCYLLVAIFCKNN